MAKFQALPHSTRNDLPAATRARVGVLLNARLADTIDLQLQAKQAHWNVKGPNFIALHELFDKVADAAEEASDMLAERLVALGGRAEGTVQVVDKRTTLRSYSLTLASGPDHVQAVADAIATVAWRRARRSTTLTGRETRERRICSPSSRAISTSCCGWSRRTCNPE